MPIILNVLLTIADIAVCVLFIKKFCLRKEHGGYGKKIYLCICLIAFVFSWSEMFFELRMENANDIMECVLTVLEHAGMLGAPLGLLWLDRKYGHSDADDKKVLWILGMFPVLELLWDGNYYMYPLDTLNEDQIVQMVKSICIPAWIVFLLSDILLCILYYKIADVQRERTQTLLLAQQYETERRHFADVELMQKQVRGIRHDLKNLTGSALALLDGEDYDGARNLFVSVGAEIDLSERTIVTGNPALDGILNVKLSKARGLGIPVQTDIDIPGGLCLDYAAMAVVLGNLIDNAIEAEEKLGSRLIEVTVKYMNQMLIMQIANRCEETNADNFLTTKPDAGEHGFGIENVRRYVEKLGGTAQFLRESGRFYAKVILYHVLPSQE